MRLAHFLSLPYHETMQDWEWEVADAARIDEFLRTYESNILNEDEQFSLMEIIIQSVEESATACTSIEWQRTLDILDRNILRHAHSVWYWANLEDVDKQAHWRVTPDLRRLLEKHRTQLDIVSAKTLRCG